MDDGTGTCGMGFDCKDSVKLDDLPYDARM